MDAIIGLSMDYSIYGVTRYKYLVGIIQINFTFSAVSTIPLLKRAIRQANRIRATLTISFVFLAEGAGGTG